MAILPAVFIFPSPPEMLDGCRRRERRLTNGKQVQPQAESPVTVKLGVERGALDAAGITGTAEMTAVTLAPLGAAGSFSQAEMSGPFYDVTAEIDGRRYTGTWTLKQGGLICVAWAESAKTVELGKTRPEVKAVTVLRDLVKARQRQREREQRALEAKRRKLSPNSP